jgi:hypothetical protein
VRLTSPQVRGAFFTPFFGHFALVPLILRGEMDFALTQYRICWGWALGSQRTTWLEVFDTGWSHCHHWSGCPTWQLSQFVLGLRHRFDREEGSFDFTLLPGSLRQASGRMPLPTSGYVDIKWYRRKEKIYYEATSTKPIHIRFSGHLAELNAAQGWRKYWSFQIDSEYLKKAELETKQTFQKRC